MTGVSALLIVAAITALVYWIGAVIVFSVVVLDFRSEEGRRSDYIDPRNAAILAIAWPYHLIRRMI